MSTIRGLLIAGSLLAGAIVASAQSVPLLMNYQGSLMDQNGTNVGPGEYELSFSVWDLAEGGSQIWGPQTFNGQSGPGLGSKVPVVDGHFNVAIGPDDTQGRKLIDAFTGPSRFLQIQVGNNPPISPRQQILSAPFALRTAKADDATTMGGYSWQALLGNQDPASGKIDGARVADRSVKPQQLDLNAMAAANSFWNTSGNVGTTPGTHFLGTRDTQPLLFRINNQDVMKLGLGPSGNDYRLSLSVDRRDGLVFNGPAKNLCLFLDSNAGDWNPLTQAGDHLLMWKKAVVDGADAPDAGGLVIGPWSAYPKGMRITPGGWVGIGTGNPSARLEVAGSVKLDSSGDRNDFVRIVSSTEYDGQGALRFDQGSESYFAVWSAGTGIPTNSNIKIGFGHPHYEQGYLLPMPHPVWRTNRYPAQAAWENIRVTIDYQGNITANNVLLTSDRNAKENVSRIDSLEVLKKVVNLPVFEWNYTGDNSSIHMGPMAQDLKASFGLGPDDKTISSVDADGVALAAIKGMNMKLELDAQKKDSRIKSLERRNAELEHRLDLLEKRFREAIATK